MCIDAEDLISHFGYRTMVIRDGARVRLISRGGIDYARRFPWIVEAARKRPQCQFIIDGEAVLVAFTGVSDLDGLHSRKYEEEVQLRVRCPGNERRRPEAAVDAQAKAPACSSCT